LLYIKKTKQDDIAEFVGISRRTIGKIKQKLIAKVIDFFDVNPIRLGGAVKTVQIDETKLNHNVKSHRGRAHVRPDWAITMIDISTTPAKGYAEVIPDRNAATMKPIIEKVVRPRTHIQTDEWKAYDF
jgi:hypothetical protein